MKTQLSWKLKVLVSSLQGLCLQCWLTKDLFLFSRDCNSSHFKLFKFKSLFIEQRNQVTNTEWINFLIIKEVWAWFLNSESVCLWCSQLPSKREEPGFGRNVSSLNNFLQTGVTGTCQILLTRERPAKKNWDLFYFSSFWFKL